MSSAMMMLERSMTMPGMSSAPMGAPAMPAMMPGSANWMMVPRCEITVEKCDGGMCLNCVCDDDVACGALQNLCKMLAGQPCSCCCTWNGMTLCQCNLCCGKCECEMTKNGCKISCTSGDKACCEMLQQFCKCLSTCMQAGCTCYVCFGNTPVCCCTC